MKNNQECPVVSFDLGCKDSQATQDFYHRVFGWEMTPAKHNVKVNTGSQEGVQGSITSLGHEPHQYVMIYIQVPDIEEKLNAIKSEGGEVHIGPLPTGYGQQFAWIEDPGGNMIGILSNE